MEGWLVPARLKKPSQEVDIEALWLQQLVEVVSVVLGGVASATRTFLIFVQIV